jgi:dTDP-glucose pyrophosphorylase
MQRINETRRNIALVVDADNRMRGTITDGDIRRALLAETSLDASVRLLLEIKGGPPAITAEVGRSHTQLIELMTQHSVRQLPLLDDDGRVVDLVTLDDLVPDHRLPLQAVIMAGGNGTRLRPLTEELPKPMLPVGGRPLMERIITGLREAGIKRVNVSTHYKPEKIYEHFRDGQDFGVELNYMTEDRPLGTAGALGMLTDASETLLVINGDILTEVNFHAFVAYHREHGAALTVAVRKYDMSVPYGVLTTEGGFVRNLVEKPVISLFVNAGIYLVEPRVLSYIPNGEHFDMPDLMQCLLKANQPVLSFPIHEYWLDIGQHADYLKAQEDIKTRRGGIGMAR